MKRVLTVFLAVVLMAGTARAQETGIIEGRVVEPDTRVPVAGATVSVEGGDAETITDSNGAYRLEVPPGTYTLQFEAGQDYARESESGIEVTAGQTVSRVLELARQTTDGEGTQAAEFGEFTVQAGYLEGSPASVITTQREAPQVSDVIGADQMAAAGDSDAAGALKRVTGLSVEDGKYVSIRGQPERYTRTTLNGSPLPSPDPIRRIAPLDLFPTSILSAVSVSKSYDASMAGSFGGGLVDLRTRAAPPETFFEISVSTGGNTRSTGEEGLEYEGGDRDYLGHDDGTREISGGLDGELDGQSGNAGRLVDGARDMPNNWDVDGTTLPPDFGLSLAGGTNTSWLGADVGVQGSFSWGREYRQTDRTERRYAVSGTGLQLVDEQLDSRTDHDIDLGGFLAASFDWGAHKVTSNTFLTRKTTERTQLTTGSRTISQAVEIQDYLLDWNERQLFGEQLIGEHDLEVVKLDWRFLYAEAERDNPDRRFYRRTRALGSNDPFGLTDREDATRTFIDTRDDITSFSFDLERTILDRESLSLDVTGGAATYSQERESSTRQVGLRPDPNEVDVTAPIEEILAPENLGNGVAVSDNTGLTDFYEGTADVDALYLQGDLGWAETLRVVAGVRRENADFEVTSLTTTDDPAVSGFDKSNTLPSLSTTWFFAPRMQARVAFGRTISRPTLNEIAGDPDGTPVRYRDPDTNDQYQGNPGLEPAEIDSFDVRWEWFPSPGELVAVGFFTKDYTNPLEEELIPTTTGELRRVINADEATVEGLEATARLNAPRITGAIGLEWGWLERMYLQGNVAYIDSEVTLDTASSNESRSLQGQADQLFNLLVGYEGGNHDLTFALNHTGESLNAVTRNQPNIYTEPRTLVDINYDYRWSDSLNLSLELGNVLNQDVERTQGGRIFSTYEPGVDYSFGLNYRF